MKVAILAGGLGFASRGRDGTEAETDGGDWRQANSLAHPYALRALWLFRVRHRARLQRRSDQEVHARLLLTEPRSERLAQDRQGQDERRRGSRLECRPGRYRHEDPDRWPHQASWLLTWATKPSCSPGAMAYQTSTWTICWPFTAPTASWPRSPRCGRRARFGHLEMDGDQITEFSEKPQAKEGWINGAFFVLEPEIFDFIDGDDTHFEKEPLARLATEGQLMAYRHTAFWQCMDTIREKKYLESLWEKGNAPWKTWEESNASISNGPRGIHRNGFSANAVGSRA